MKEFNFYLRTIFLSALLFFFIFFLHFLRAGEATLRTLNQSAGGTAFLLIALSLLITPFLRFFKLGIDGRYVKYMGIVGFFFALFHAIYSLVRISDFSDILSWMSENPYAGSTGVLALLLLFFLFLISNKFSKNLFGEGNWKLLLRRGAEISFLLTLFHFTFLRYTEWPLIMFPSFLLLVIALGVIIFRSVHYLKEN